MIRNFGIFVFGFCLLLVGCSAEEEVEPRAPFVYHYEADFEVFGAAGRAAFLEEHGADAVGEIVTISGEIGCRGRATRSGAGVSSMGGLFPMNMVISRRLETGEAIAVHVPDLCQGLETADGTSLNWKWRDPQYMQDWVADYMPAAYWVPEPDLPLMFYDYFRATSYDAPAAHMRFVEARVAETPRTVMHDPYDEFRWMQDDSYGGDGRHESVYLNGYAIAPLPEAEPELRAILAERVEEEHPEGFVTILEDDAGTGYLSGYNLPDINRYDSRLSGNIRTPYFVSGDSYPFVRSNDGEWYLDTNLPHVYVRYHSSNFPEFAESTIISLPSGSQMQFNRQNIVQLGEVRYNFTLDDEYLGKLIYDIEGDRFWKFAWRRRWSIGGAWNYNLTGEE